MSEVQLPRPKRKATPDKPTTHTRIYVSSLEDLRKLSERWDTSLVEANRYLIDLATALQGASESATVLYEAMEKAKKP